MASLCCKQLVVDCVIPAHEKDFETLPLTLASIRRCCPEVSRIFVVVSDPETAEQQVMPNVDWPRPDECKDDHDCNHNNHATSARGVTFLSEKDKSIWPFDASDIQQVYAHQHPEKEAATAEGGCAKTGGGGSCGWILQQLIKLYSPLVIPNIRPAVLVCDADVVWFETVRFLEHPEHSGSSEGSLRSKLCSFTSEGCPPIRSAVDLTRYDHFLNEVLPGLQKECPGKETAVCHHACFQRDLLEALFAAVASKTSTPTSAPPQPLPPPPQHQPDSEVVGNAPSEPLKLEHFWKHFVQSAAACSGRASEYELYNAFVRRRFPGRSVVWRPTFAVVADPWATLKAPPENVVFAVAHSHLRGLSARELADREGVINGNVEREILRRMCGNQPPELLQAMLNAGML